MMKRLGLGLLALATATSFIGTSTYPVHAETYPDKPISVIVPWAAGGGSDRSTRLIADALSKRIGVNVVVVNKPGAGGAIGTRAIADAKPDGYTFGLVGSGLVARQYTNPTANKMTDVVPLAFFGPDPGALSARADTGFKNVADFVKAAKAAPSSIKNGNDQPGGSSFVNIAVLEKELGVKTTRVPYSGYAPTVAALLAGEVQTATVPIPDAIEQHKAGKIRILGVMGDERHFLAEDVPTFKEQGFDIVIGSWRALVAPKGIPEDRMKLLESKLIETLNDPEFKKRANAAGFAVTPLGAAATEKKIADFDKALYPVLLEAGLVKVNKK